MYGYGYYGYRPTPVDPGPEPDPAQCACGYRDPVGYLAPEFKPCDWYEYNSSRGPVSQDTLRAHKRGALVWQAGGYKGSQHHRSVDEARRERDRLR